MYGQADDTPRKETSALNPLTAYAKSKVRTEVELQKIADGNFTVTCLRFATACGMSDRLRLDLVVNDFRRVCRDLREHNHPERRHALETAHTRQGYGRAFDWALGRDKVHGDFLAVNVGSNTWNYQVRELAEAVAKVVPRVSISINKNAPPDNRSYRVDFSLYERLAPKHQPQIDLLTAIAELKEGLEGWASATGIFAVQVHAARVLKRLREKGMLDGNLEWTGA